MRAIFAYGRMNPPTAGHRRVIERLQQEAEREGGVVRVYLSETHDHERNPLDAQAKVDFFRRAFPGVEVRTSRTVFTAGKELAAEGVNDAIMVVGEDRLASFRKALTAYVGTDDLPLKSIEIRAVSRTDEDASASQAREAAINGDWQTFLKLSPSSDETYTRELYSAVRKGLGVENGGPV